MSLVSSEIESYCEAHSDLPSEVCNEIFAYTQKNIPMPQMLSGPLVGSFIGWLLRSIQAKRVLEIGTYTGYSALYMAERLPKDGEVITLDINPETAEIAEKFWAKSPHGSKIKSILGAASTSMGALAGTFDLIFIDADKIGYPAYLHRALLLLSPKGVIVADNCLQAGKVLNRDSKEESVRAIQSFNDMIKKDPHLEHMLLPLRDGLHLIRRK
jgi:caffeoyl-CoA O-methyltransferase